MVDMVDAKRMDPNSGGITSNTDLVLLLSFVRVSVNYYRLVQSNLIPVSHWLEQLIRLTFFFLSIYNTYTIHTYQSIVVFFLRFVFLFEVECSISLTLSNESKIKSRE